MKLSYQLAPLFVILAAAMWGMDGVLLRPNLYSLPVPLVVFIESTLVLLILMPFMYKRLKNIKLLTKEQFLGFLGVAFFGGALGTMAITKGLFYVNFQNLSVVVLIQKLQPFFAITSASIILKEKLPGKFYLWALGAMVGSYLLIFGFSAPNLNTGDKTLIAAIFALVAAFSFGVSTVLSKLALKDIDFKTGVFYRFLFTSVLMLIFVTANRNLGDISQLQKSQSIIFLIIAFTSGGGAIFLYYFGLKRISASVATICELSFPLTALILDYFVRGTVLSLGQWMGIAILLLAMKKVSQYHD